MKENNYNSKFERKLAVKSKLFSWALQILFRKSSLEVMAFMLDTYSDGIKNIKEFNYQQYSELKKRIEVVPK